MKINAIVTSLLVLLLSSSFVVAEEVDKAAQCDQTFDQCMVTCDEKSDGAETCYQTCENTYEECLKNSEN
jgi:hypothetical protein